MEHHAYLLIGHEDWARAQIPPECTVPGPDVSILRFERMSIADARTLSHDAYIRPVAHEHRTFVIIAETLQGEAQNALLKLLEEPPKSARFYFVIPNEDVLLPTVRSRFMLLGHEESVHTTEALTQFLALNHADRLACIANKMKAEDTEWVRTIVRELAHYAENRKDPVLIREVLDTERYLGNPGSSKKMLLEHLALSL